MARTQRRPASNGRAATIAAQLRARGTKVDLGGTKIRLIFTWDAIEELERDWGTLGKWVQEVQSGAEGAMFRAVGAGVAACVTDLPVPTRSLMELGRIGEYAEALVAALAESGLWMEDAEGNAEGATTPPSPGKTSGTSISSTATTAPSSSGQ